MTWLLAACLVGFNLILLGVYLLDDGDDEWDTP